MVLCYKVAWEQWHQGRVSKSMQLSEDAHELKGNMNYSCLIFSLPVISCNFIFFFCSDTCASRDLLEQKTESSELKTCWRSSLYKNKLTQVSDTIEACYYNDQNETRKITNAYNVFFVLSLRAGGVMLSLQMARF